MSEINRKHEMAQLLFKNWICANPNEIVSALLSMYCKNIIILNSNFSKKFAYVDFKLANTTGYTKIPLPEGFAKNNCVVTSLVVLYNGNLFFYDDCTSFYVTTANGDGLQVFNSYEIFYGTTAGVSLMRVDI